MSSKPSPARVLPAHLAEPRWRPGLPAQPFHSEIFAPAGEASGAGLALALARDALNSSSDAGAAQDIRQLLWVQDRKAMQLGGRPCLAGLPPEWRHRVIHVAAATPEDALFALEEGLKCRDLACVIGEIAGNPRALSFTASRRLSLMAERHGVRLWLVRLDAQPDLSSARMRWQARAAPSLPPRWNAAAPGTARWHAELFRARAHAPGEWILSDDTETLRLRTQPNACESDTDFAVAPDPVRLARPTVGRSLAARARA
ncbi:MAG: recA-like protein [Sphingomonadales bacterium]|nr:recA-like protein [Sphingomonadales bacterium]NCQ21465.1 recA-like protein [Sphingomonadales bacterium]NCT04252.1 recA-like protein [Sphingomonadales bacterium]